MISRYSKSLILNPGNNEEQLIQVLLVMYSSISTLFLKKGK